MTRITEKQLVLPTLYLLSKSNNGFVTTSDLITKLTEVMKPTGIDAEILSGRSDTYFSQKVRNLKSHDALQRRGYATNYNDGFMITQSGINYVATHVEALSYLFNEDFNYEDVKNAIDSISDAGDRKVLPIEEYISEGRLITKNIQIRERSYKLRNIAIEHFSQNNMICCECCGFNFQNYYGNIYGKNCIEIHHRKPIFQYQDDSFDQQVASALENLLPVCPNCHRVIHKNHIGNDELNVFISNIRQRRDISEF